ncbi:MAG: molybdenum cofactor biosynthesis protein C [Thaumarchaeota archaeon RBG_16_49_8]|nr:MAG: molybdenum cofactor biosynthesis protein C [Thaumarchaeota archaeon RBG_16_49_8]
MGVRMVDVHAKTPQYREATASGEIQLKPETVNRIRDGKVEKGDPFQIATLAGIQGAKMTPTIIPLCHPIPIENTSVQFELTDSGVKATAKVVATAKTGVEMEALTALATALLNIWDVVKMYEKNEAGQYPTTQILNIKVVEKVKR